MINIYINQQRQTIEERAKKSLANLQANQTAVLVAKNDIPRGAVIDAELLETAIIPNQYVQPQAVTSLDRVAGMITVAPISKGEQITLSRLTYSREIGRGSLAESTPVGKRAVTVSVDNIATLAGMLKPGNYVDVIAMVPVPAQNSEGKQDVQLVALPLFQNVLVLAVGQETGMLQQSDGRYRREEKKEASPLVTFALSPQEANLITFVQEQSKIRLVLRSPADSQLQPVQPASWDALFQYVMPKETARPLPKKEEPKTAEFVEIYRGLSREQIPLSK